MSWLKVMGWPLGATDASHAREARAVRSTLQGRAVVAVDHPRDRWSLSLAAMPLAHARALRALAQGHRWDFSRGDYGSNQTTYSGEGVFVSVDRLTVPSAGQTATMTADLSRPWTLIIEQSHARTVVLSTGEAYQAGAVVAPPATLVTTPSSFSLGFGQYLGFVACARVSPAGALELSRHQGRPGLDGCAVQLGQWAGQADVSVTGMPLDASGQAVPELELLTVPAGLGVAP